MKSRPETVPDNALRRDISRHCALWPSKAVWSAREGMGTQTKSLSAAASSIPPGSSLLYISSPSLSSTSCSRLVFHFECPVSQSIGPIGRFHTNINGLSSGFQPPAEQESVIATEFSSCWPLSPATTARPTVPVMNEWMIASRQRAVR